MPNTFTSSDSKQPLKLFAFTLDLEADYAGCIDRDEIFKDLGKIEEVLSSLKSLGVKVTAFTVGKLFETNPDVIKLFEKYDCELEAHSYSHDFENPDSDYEVTKSREAFFNYCGRYPTGYRAPRGDISGTGIRNLAKNNFLYDSSVIPSFFPNPLRILTCNHRMHIHEESDILEIPVTAITPFRLLLSVSYIKMLGINLFKTISRIAELPDVICFDSHLHDFIFVEDSYNRLFPLWKFFYGINKHKGLEYCINYLEFIKAQGYTYCYMSDIYNMREKLLNTS